MTRPFTLCFITLLGTGCATLKTASEQQAENADLAVLVYGTTVDATREQKLIYENVVIATEAHTPRNIVSLFRKRSTVSLELEPVEQITPTEQLLAGTTQFQSNHAKVDGAAFAQIGWATERTVDPTTSTRSWPLTQFALGFQTPVGPGFFDLLPHKHNTIAVEADGTGTLYARVAVTLPKGMFTILDDLWIELPIQFKGDQLWVEANRVPSAQLTPLVGAMHASADTRSEK